MTIYLTGGTGFVGSNFLRVALERHGAKVFAALNKSRLEPCTNLSMDLVNLTNEAEVMASVKMTKPDAIVHMAFYNDIPLSYARREDAWGVMVKATEYLTEAARELNIPIVFVSSDWVFDGTQSPATEAMPPNPINYYGVLKVVGETLVTQYEKGAVARIAGVFGPYWARENWQALQNTGFGNLPVATVHALQGGNTFDLWMRGDDLNLHATPTLASDACEMMIKIIEQNAAGIFHCCGGEGLSRTEVAQRSAKAFGLDPSLINEASVDPNQMGGWQGIPIPEDTRLDAAETARVLNHPLLSFDESLAKLKIQLETGELA